MSNVAKRSRSLSPVRDGLPTNSLNHKPKKVKPLHSSTLVSVASSSPSSSSPHSGVSPFPGFSHPTPSEAHDVFHILQSEFPANGNVRKNPSENAASTCGNVSDVIESLIGTILSQNTTAANSGRAKQNLDATFGPNNFDAIARAPCAEVVQAIRHGGLANKKAATIQRLLAAIHAKHGAYSLQHLADASACSDSEAMRELVAYNGVGPKTASCVLLFCLGRQSFPVDTHVFRLSKVLGWVPPNANRVSAQAHLDVRIPGELKYGLHVLMVSHGRSCSGCKNRAKGPCSLKTYVKKRNYVKEEQTEDGPFEQELLDPGDVKPSS
jgi:endonuclease III